MMLRGSQISSSRPVDRPLRYALSHPVPAVVPRLVHKSVHMNLLGLSARSVRGWWNHGCVEVGLPDEQETVSSWTNPWIAEYKRRQAMLTDMRPFEVIAILRDLNLTSYAFSKNAEDLQAHVLRYLEIGQSQPFNPDIGDPFGIELARLLANLLASVGSLISGQRAVLRDIWPKVGKNFVRL
jgi:hypothetical protein